MQVLPKKKEGLVYLASPYTHKDDNVVEERVSAVCDVSSKLMKQGIYILSPIAHCHAIAVIGGLPTDFVFWRDYDHTLINACVELWVLCIDGWKESKGIAGEIEYATSQNKPVWYLNPDTLELYDRETIET